MPNTSSNPPTNSTPNTSGNTNSISSQQHASWSRFNQTVAALRFFYNVTLQRPNLVTMIPYGKKPKTLPAVLSTDEVARLFEAVPQPRYRLLLQTAYAAGLRVSEVVALQITDIDSQRMVLHIRCAKGRKDRLVPLSALLLQRLRDYWRRYRPQRWLFPGQTPTRPPQHRSGATHLPSGHA